MKEIHTSALLLFQNILMKMDFENIFENIRYQEFFFVYLSNTEEQSQVRVTWIHREIKVIWIHLLESVYFVHWPKNCSTGKKKFKEIPTEGLNWVLGPNKRS